MAFADGSKTRPEEFDEVYYFVCGPCKSDQGNKEAKYFCQDCQEHLCDVCHEAHRKLKVTRNHAIFPGRKMPRPSVVKKRFIVNCNCNQNRGVEIYCEDHKDVMCSSCKTVKHRKCKTSPIKDKSTGYTDVSHTAILNKVKILKDKLQRLQQERNADQIKIQRIKDECLKEITSFRKEINTLLDTLEQNTRKELDACTSGRQSQAAQRTNTLSTTFQMLDVDEKLLEDALEDNEKETMFACNVKVTTAMKDYETVLADIVKETISTVVSFERNKKLVELMGEMKSLGHILDVAKNTCNKVLLDMQAKLSSQHKAVPSDVQCESWITGCRFLTNGYLLICDYYNSSITLLDNAFTIKTSIRLNGKPWDVSVFDGGNAIVTLPDAQQLRSVQVFPQMKTGRVVQLDKPCYGVEVAYNEIYISCCNKQGDGEIRILDLKGNMKRSLGVDKDGSFQFDRPYNLTVNKSATKIFVSDLGKSTITCRLVSGETLYQYKEEKLTCPRGLFVDDDDNVVVCDGGSDTVHIITADGRKHKTLLSFKKYPCSIAFRDTDNMLVVCCYHRDEIFCFSLSPTD